MTNYSILIAEDDSDISNLLREILTQAGYHVLQAYSGTEARLLFEQNMPTLLLLDLMLPGMTGEELIIYVRNSSRVPIIVVSAKETGTDKVNALRLGADDYITKPFDSEELLARIEANIRRGQFSPQKPTILSYHDLAMDTDARRVTAAGRDIPLTAREFAILELMMINPRKVFTKANIYTSVWHEEFFGDDNTVNVHISNLRAKLQGDYIQTVWGIGFKLQE